MPEEALEERAAPHGGPGGQHANRSSTRIELRVSVERIGLREDELDRLRRRMGSRISREGVLSVTVGEFRSQLRNRRAARTRLAEVLAEGIAPDPAPRRQRRVPRGVVERRLEEKRQQSQRKRGRSWRPGDE